MKKRININTIEKIGRLTRIKFSDNEKEEFRKDLESIDKMMSKICEVNTENIEPLIYLNQDCVTLRSDITENHPVEGITKNAPDFSDGFYKVPPVMKKKK